MGTDIYCRVEQQIDVLYWEEVRFDPPIFDWRSYRLFGWLADVRNYSCVGPLVPQRGYPEGFVNKSDYGYCPTWYLLSELLAVDYNQTVEDRRTTLREGNIINCAHITEKGNGICEPLKKFLGEGYFADLGRLVERAKVINCPTDKIRLVLWFDC